MARVPGDQGNNSTSEDESDLGIMSPSNFGNMMDEDEAAETFDKTVGALEDILMSPSFQNLYTSQLEHCYESYIPDCEDKSSDNFQLFKNYSQSMSLFMESELKNVFPDFDMEQFLKIVQQRVLDDVLSSEGDIIEVLLSLVDITKFDELMEDCRNAKEGNTIDLSPGLTVTHID